MDDRANWIPEPDSYVFVPDLPPAAAALTGEGGRLMDGSPEFILPRAGGVSEGPNMADEPKNDKSSNEKSHPPFPVSNPCDLAGRALPPRRWIVPDWLPIGHTTALYGDGGTGKTLLAQQLMTACATGLPFLGIPLERRRVIALFCEDDEDELHRRQDAINESYGVGFEDLKDIRWVCGVGQDNLLFTFSDGIGKLTDRYLAFADAAQDFRATLVVVDTAADTFGGNENDRSQVRQFISSCLTRLARSLGGAVLLNAHPSRSGLSTAGDLDGGSTGWSNTVRSRWALARPKGEDGEPADTDERILSRRKANYAAIGTEIKLRYGDGVLMPAKIPVATAGVGGQAAAEMVFLQLLDEAHAAGRKVSDSAHAPNHAPKVFAKSPARKGFSRKDFGAAMERLFSCRAIRMENYGRPGDARRHIVKQAPKAGEGG